MQTIIRIITSVALIFIAFMMLGSIVNLFDTLTELKMINSEMRDTLNVQTCYLLNDNEDSFNNCLNDKTTWIHN